MWTTLAMTAALALGQTGELRLTNVRPTYGPLMGPRKDAENLKLLPGDLLCISFDIENLKVAPDGQVKYSTAMEVTDKNGKVQYRQEPQDFEAYHNLGGGHAPAAVASDIGTDTPPGEYTITGTITDRSTKTTKKLSQKFEVLPKGFGLVRLGLSYDQGGLLPAPPVGVAGQHLFVNFWVAGFERDKDNKMPNVTGSLRILENGRPTLEKNLSGSIKMAAAGPSLIPFTFALSLNRPGKFTVEVKATDEIGKKTATQTFDLTVLEVK
jgi:hypothetical protein